MIKLDIKRIIIIAGRFSFALNNFNFLMKIIIKLKKFVFFILNYLNFIQINSENTTFIFVPDIPISDLSLSDFLKSLNEKMSHMEQCNFKIDKFIEERSTFDEIIKKLILRNKNVYIFDFVKSNCSDLTCKFFYEKFKPIYSRKNHFSIEFSQFISKDFYNFLDNLK